MKLLLLAGLAAAAGVVTWVQLRPTDGDTHITSRVLVPGVIPFGVNLGNWNAWGAEQFASNVLKNPGFEGVIDRAVVLPLHSLAGSFDDSSKWLARPESFWDGAHYDVRTGLQAGTRGTVTHSSEHNLFGLPAFLVQDESKLPDAGQVVALTKESSDAVPTQWWFAGPPGSFAPENAETRPGSPGKRSLRMSSRGGTVVELQSYLDAIGQRAGKLLPLDGEWSLSFWVRAAQGAPRLHVTWGRDGSPAVLSQDVALSGSWAQRVINFKGTDAGAPGIVALRFQMSAQPFGQVLLDDVDLHRVEDAGFPFKREVVATLESLHPRFIRDWEGQLGDTLANRIAAPFARKAYRYRPGDATQTDYGYGLRDVLDLCLRVKADPWIIVPTTFSDEECAGLGTYLAAQSDSKQFHELILEFGNENWNEVFRPAGIQDAVLHGQAADRCLASLQQHAAGLPLKLVINAQHANTASAINFAHESKAADMEAVAPYFLPALAQNTPRLEALQQLFAGDGGRMEKIAAALSGLHKETAVYEVNLTTTAGTAPGDERTPIVAGMASGSALAKTMLDALAEGVRRQCVYSLGGFDSQLPGSQGFVRLWGIARDLGPTNRLRPTGLALVLLNRAIDGEMYEIQSHGPKNIFIYAFHSMRGWAVALVSARDTPQQITLQFAELPGGPLPGQMLYLKSKNADSTNEDSADVYIAHHEIRAAGNKLSLEIEPWTLAVLLPGGGTP